MSDGGKGSERLHARTQIDDKEMERKWEQTFRKSEEEVVATDAFRTMVRKYREKKEVTMEEVEEIVKECNTKYHNALKELGND